MARDFVHSVHLFGKLAISFKADQRSVHPNAHVIVETWEERMPMMPRGPLSGYVSYQSYTLTIVEWGDPFRSYLPMDGGVVHTILNGPPVGKMVLDTTEHRWTFLLDYWRTSTSSTSLDLGGECRLTIPISRAEFRLIPTEEEEVLEAFTRMAREE